MAVGRGDPSLSIVAGDQSAPNADSGRLVAVCPGSFTDVQIARFWLVGRRPRIELAFFSLIVELLDRPAGFAGTSLPESMLVAFRGVPGGAGGGLVRLRGGG
jgi:hypothetical protein